MRIAQISDFHYTQLTWNPFRLFSKRILGNLNWLLNRKNVFSPQLLEPIPGMLRSLGVDLVLLGGDFTTTALREEYEKASRFVQKLSQPWIAVPGNHDHYTYSSFRNKHFYQYFSNRREPISHTTDFFHLKEHGVEAHRIAPHWWLIALDTAQATSFTSSRGLFNERQEAYLREVLSLIPPDDRIICFNHYPFFQQDEPQRNLMRGEHLQKILQEHPQIRLYLHGHTHRHSIADLQPNGLPILLDSGCAVQGKEASWNLIDLMPDHCSISAYGWKEDHWEPFREEVIRWKTT